METRSPALQRAAPLVHLPPLLAELGVPFDAVFEGTGVAPGDLRPDAFIPYATVLAILERAASVSGCEDLGLRLGLRQNLDTLGPVGRVMRHATTLGAALGDFVAVQISNSTGSAVYLRRTRDDFVMGYGTYAGPASAQVHDTAIAAGCALVRSLTNGAVRPLEIASMRPPPADPGPWLRLADGPVRFGQSETCLILPRAALGFRLPAADRAAHDTGLAALAAHMARPPWSTEARVRHATRSLLLEGRSKMPDIARHLGTTPRTLRRALEREETTFEAIRDGVRFAVARELLTLSVLPVGDIAMALDFASSSAFIHAFRRWSGTSPAAWREARAAKSGPDGGGRAGRVSQSLPAP